MMTITLHEYLLMLNDLEEQYGFSIDDGDCAVIWDEELGEWCVYGPSDQTVH